MNFEVKMTSGILYNYLLRQNYYRFSGIIGITLGIALLVCYFIFYNPWLIAAGAIMLLYPPWSLFTSAKKQMLLNPSFKKPLHYHFDDEGVKVSQENNVVEVPWELIFKVVVTKKTILIYTSPVNAWILPYQALGENADILKEMIKSKLPSAKVRGI